jgi:4-hydroxybenzoate polyprenyltransferase/phosphoserine phosphatase
MSSEADSEITAGAPALEQEGARAAARLEPPLVVDLDGTLITSDLLDECASRFVTDSPLQVWRLLVWLARGRLVLKRELATRATLDVPVLPYNLKLVEWLYEEHERGRRLVLASASNQRLVDAIASHLDIFDNAIGSGDEVNLKSDAKGAALVELYGERGFDYVGNHVDDLQVWAHARQAHLVDPPQHLVERAAAVTTVGDLFGWRGRHPVRQLLRAMRPHQWAKNLLLLVPMLAAQKLGSLQADLQVALAFVTFSMVASGVYLLNDIADVENDRHHPTKRRRPFASGRLRLAIGWFAWPVLTGLAFTLALVFLPWYYALSLLGYLVLTVTYTFWLKGRAVVDVVALGGLYTVRIVCGAAAISVPLSFWLLTFSLFFFLSLALIKRVSELTRLRLTGGAGKGRGYRASDLEMLSSYGVASSMASCVIFAIYVHEPGTANLYDHAPVLWATLPIMMSWLMRMWLLSHRGLMTEDPVLYAARDRTSLLAGVALAAVFVIATI